MNQNYNEAIKYHKLRKLKKSKKTDKSTEQEEEEIIDTSETSEELSEGEDTLRQEETVVESKGEMPKLLLVPKQEPIGQTPLPASERQ